MANPGPETVDPNKEQPANQSSGGSANQSVDPSTVLDIKDSLIFKLLEHLREVQQTIPGNEATKRSNDTDPAEEYDQAIRDQTEKLKNDLNYIFSCFEKLGAFEGKATTLLKNLKLRVNTGGAPLRAKKLLDKLRAIDKIVLELKLRIPLPHKLSSKDSDAQRNTRSGDGSDEIEGADELPGLQFEKRFCDSTTFKDFRVVYESLELRTKICFLCFAAIPEDEVVMKRFMIYWWISEGFLSQEELNEDSYKEADRIFEELVEKECLEPVNGKDRVVKSYRMNPFIRSAVIVFAKGASFFDFNEKDCLTALCPTSYRACMVNGFLQESVKKISDLKRTYELVDEFSRDVGKGDSVLVKRLQDLEIDPKLIKELLESYSEISSNWRNIYSALVQVLEETEIDAIISEDTGKDSAVGKILGAIGINCESIERLLERPIDPNLVKKLQEMDSELFNIFPKDSEKINSESIKKLKENPRLAKRLLETDSPLFDKLEKIDGELVKRYSKKLGKRVSELVKGLWQIGIHSALVERLRQRGIDSALVKRLLKMKIGTELVKGLLEMKEKSDLIHGFFEKLTKRFPKLKEVSQLVIRNFGVGSSEAARQHPQELMKIGSELVNGSSKVLGEIGAELIHRFSKKLDERDLDSFNGNLQEKCRELCNELSEEFHKVGAGLVYGPSEELGNKATRSVKKRHSELGNESSELDPEKVQTIFNVNEPYPDFFHPEWFSKLKNVKVLYLGRWQSSPKHHIEMESTDFLKGLENMKLLKFFSLQGISRITKLPDSVCKLLSLKILDLRACHNLEKLPEGIGSLKKLTHFDMSECYLLSHMPKSIKELSSLEVFKGFIIISNSSAKSCKLKDLAELEKLRKLSIYTNRKNFPIANEVTAFGNIKMLQKLTITWGPAESTNANTKDTEKEEIWRKILKCGCLKRGNCASHADSDTGADTKVREEAGVSTRLGSCFCLKRGKKEAPKSGKDQTNQDAFKILEKLELKCYPNKDAPDWLQPERLPELKKLYIRGGELQSLNLQESMPWKKVEILRLKFLRNLKMDWAERRSSFPSLEYLEKFQCPELTFFPSNENGIWLKPEKTGE